MTETKGIPIVFWQTNWGDWS